MESDEDVLENHVKSPILSFDQSIVITQIDIHESLIYEILILVAVRSQILDVGTPSLC